MTDPWLLLASLLAILGLVGTVLPVVPGAPLIFLGALAYDFGHQWRVFGPFWLGLLLALMLLSIGTEWLLSSVGARRGGASWPALIAGFAGGLLGLIIFSLPGLLIGSIGSVVGVEWLRHRQAGKALRAGSGWLIGWFLSAVLELVIGIAMIAVMIWRIG